MTYWFHLSSNYFYWSISKQISESCLFNPLKWHIHLSMHIRMHFKSGGDIFFITTSALSHLVWFKMLFVQLLVTHSVMSNSLRPHGPQHAKLPCLSLFPGVCANSCPLNQWCHPTISSSVIPFSSCPQSFPASGSFLMSQLFTSGGQSIGASASVLSMNSHDWFDLLAVQGTLKSLLQHHSSKALKLGKE